MRRAGAYAAVGALALAAPLLGRATVVPFLLVAALALLASDGPIFELFARRTDREQGRLQALSDFALAVTILAGLSTFGTLPVAVFSGTVLLVALGNLGAEIVRARTDHPSTLGFLAGGVVGAAVGLVGATLLGGGRPEPGTLLLLSVTGALLGGLIRSMLFPRDEPPVLLSVGLVLWFLASVDAGGDPTAVAVAIAIMGVFGLLSFALDTGSIDGVLAGVLLGLLAIVLAGYEWFALLLTFFAVGGLATKFRYAEKLERGVAEENGGTRGGENVLANSLVAAGAVFGLAAVEAGLLDAGRELVLVCYAGAVATALGDTLSSEIGGAFDGARLITSYEPVAAGTDGAITWQGTLAGAAGATLIGALTVALFPAIAPAGLAVVAVAGLAGMTVDSLLGATVEGGPLGNAGVNFLATLAGALACAGLAVASGLLAVGTLPV